MLTNTLRLTDWRKGVQYPPVYTIQINAYWVTILDGKKVIFKREPSRDGWGDSAHKKITDAINALEEAIFEAVDSH